jgi:hypothetical protein
VMCGNWCGFSILISFKVPQSTLLHLLPSDSSVSADADFEPRTVVTLVALTVTVDNLTTRLDLLHKI